MSNAELNSLLGDEGRRRQRHDAAERADSTSLVTEAALRAGRPEALGHRELLRLQRTAGNAGVQRLVAGGGDEHEEESPVHGVIRTPGEPLDAGTRGAMEARLGHDFGDVRIHTDSAAAGSARSVQATAYTVGSHVVFGEGSYRPDSEAGQHVLAHELTHVVQQRNGPVDGTAAAGGILLSSPSDRFEREAEHVASSTTPAPAAAGPAPAAASVQPSVQRAEEDEQAAEAPASEAPASEAPAPEAPAEADEAGGEAVQAMAVQRETDEEAPDER
ncbi:eCIS core domain-containing protein [Motilibacter deserti]|uniref:DUF4157 domain-containing protein n=1 Tax=Motilibacter deserti TaxID=2714956 RepID=A0ABX0GSG9_9ACTN|nr:DUF4157 domain-containing protein [Motilibacter deserti]NHC13812.1 DUF4157 domain-containing protein [Motilibacter deserti]